MKVFIHRVATNTFDTYAQRLVNGEPFAFGSKGHKGLAELETAVNKNVVACKKVWQPQLVRDAGQVNSGGGK
jgi:hypothetical protein